MPVTQRSLLRRLGLSTGFVTNVGEDKKALT